MNNIYENFPDMPNMYFSVFIYIFNNLVKWTYLPFIPFISSHYNIYVNIKIENVNALVSKLVTFPKMMFKIQFYCWQFRKHQNDYINEIIWSCYNWW